MLWTRYTGTSITVEVWSLPAGGVQAVRSAPFHVPAPSEVRVWSADQYWL